MNYDFQQTRFSRSVLSGLATGTIVIIASLLYNYIYRNITDFTVSWIVNVTSIIFSSFIVCVIGGILFYLIVPYWQKNKLIYTALFVIITIVFILIGLSSHRSPDPAISQHFRVLFIGDVCIIGFSCAFLIPWFALHKNAFFD